MIKFNNITAQKYKKLQKSLNEFPAAKGLSRFVVAEELMAVNPDWFADDLLSALLLHFGIVTVISTQDTNSL